MEETEDEGRYLSNPYRVNRNSGTLQHPKLQTGSISYSMHDDSEFCGDDDNEDMIEVGAKEEDYEEVYDDEDDIDEFRSTKLMNRGENLDNRTDDENDEDEYEDKQNGVSSMRDDEDELGRHRKKRKLKSLLSSYRSAPRVASVSASKQTHCEPSTFDWTEHETFFLLEAWGDKFLKRGRRSLRSEEWQEVAEEVSQESKVERTEAQCRTRFDALRKKYKKEKVKSDERGGFAGKWVYFRRMDALMSPPPQKQTLSCGMDSGEYVFMNPKAYLDLANGMDELRDSPYNSESAEDGDDDDNLDGPQTNRGRVGNAKDDGASFRLLADSVDKFGEIYEKIEHGKRQQLAELEKMRVDFQKELELQKRQILERAEMEIARIRQIGDGENDLSGENLSE